MSFRSGVGDPIGVGFPTTVWPATRSGLSALPAANDATYHRVLGSGTISKIAVHVGTSAGNISVAVHRNTGAGRDAAPGAQAATSGAVACPASGYAEVPLGAAVQVNQGDWFALSASDATATFTRADGTGVGSDLGKGNRFRQLTAHPVPATPSSLVTRIGDTFVLTGVP